VLAVQLLDRSRHTAVIAAISAGGQSGLLSVLMHRAVASLGGDAGADKATTPGGGGQPFSLAFVEALLSLVGALSASSSGCNALAEAGVVPALLPLLGDAAPERVMLVGTAVRILEAFMDYSPAAAASFRDMGGLSAMIQRLAAEVGPPAPVPEQALPAAGSGKGGPEDMQTDEAAAAAPAASAASPQPPQKGPVSYARRVLLKSLLRAIALSSYAPPSRQRTAAAVGQAREEDRATLFACLRAIYERAPDFGGGLFALAASVMTDLIHHDPLCFQTLEDAGLPGAFLAAIKVGPRSVKQQTSLPSPSTCSVHL
jgi:E3 ubiquitin-protein ligase HUWE1